MIAPCKDCSDRCIGCHSVCDKYKDFRATCDAVSAAKRREFAADEAGALRGDKIRRDAHRFGLKGRLK